MHQSLETILVDVTDEGVATITLNRPERMNAFNLTMRRELRQAFLDLDADEAVRAIVVTGAGRAFSAGADLQRGGETFAGGGASSEALPEVRPWELRTPIIAAINGAAVGMGLTLPMQWDVRYAAEDAKLGFVFNRRGVIPEANSTWIVPRLVGVSNAMEVLLSGRIFTGAEAKELGLVSKALPADEVLPAAQDLARDIAVNAAPLSVAVTKRMVYGLLEVGDREESMRIDHHLFYWIGALADSAEGVQAFLERRDPAWKLSKHHDVPEELI